MTSLDKLLSLLETYKGRDRFLRLLCYSSKCAAGLIKSPQLGSRFENFSRQLSTSRACFRLLDDIPVIASIILNGKNREELSPNEKIVAKVENVLNVIFSPLDHISWAIEHKIIISNDTIWETASIWCWVISLYLNIYKIFMNLSKLSHQKMEIVSQPEARELKKNLLDKQWYLEMSALKCVTDLLFAVNYLPKGLLWAQFFKKWQVGALGSLSSIVSLYQALVLDI